MSFLSFNYGFWDQWLDPMKVTFDGENKLIIVNFGETVVDVQMDIYSAWKRWVSQLDNSKFPQALKVIGGDPIDETNIITPYYFLTNGWRIRPFEGHHKLTINGIILTDDNQDPLVATVQHWNISVTRIVPVKSESVLTPVPSNAPTSAENAQAVWTAILAQLAAAGNAAEKLGSLENTQLPASYPISTTDKQDIATEVWEKPISTTVPGTFGDWMKNKLITVSKYLSLS
jgi:hypothetical protein